MKKIEYFLNAICYELWLFEKLITKYIEFSVDWLFPKRIREKMSGESWRWFDIEIGHCAHRAYFLVSALSFWYCSIGWGALCGLMQRLYDNVLCSIVMAIPFFFVSNWCTSFIEDEIRVPYFQTFLHESKQWHRKWASITIMVSAGSILAIILSLYVFSFARGDF